MSSPVCLALGASLLLVGCGENVRVTDPVAPSSPSVPAAPGIAAELLVRAGPLRKDFYGGKYPPGVAVGMGNDGRGWAIWTRMSPPRVEAARFENGRWLPPITLHDATLPSDGHPGRDASGAAIAVNAAGHAVAGWTENHGDWITMASRWDGVGWAPAVRVQDVPTGTYATRGRGVGIAGAPAISLDDAGNAWLMWWRAPEASYPHTRPLTLVASRQVPGAAWAREEVVADPSIYSNGSFGIAPLPDGEALVAWGHDRVLRTARLSPSRRWRWGIITEAREAGDRISGPLVAAVPPRGALVAWAVSPMGSAPIRDLSVMAVETGLGGEAPVAVAAEGAGPPRIAVSPTGRILIVWTTATAQWARWAESATAPLGPPVAIAEGLTSPSGPELAVDAAGNALAMWIDGTNGRRVVVSRFAAGRMWTEPETIHQGSQSDTFTLPQLAMDGAGNAIAAFSVAGRVVSGSEGEFEVRAAHFPAPR